MADWKCHDPVIPDQWHPLNSMAIRGFVRMSGFFDIARGITPATKSVLKKDIR